MSPFVPSESVAKIPYPIPTPIINPITIPIPIDLLLLPEVLIA